MLFMPLRSLGTHYWLSLLCPCGFPQLPVTSWTVMLFPDPTHSVPGTSCTTAGKGFKGHESLHAFQKMFKDDFLGLLRTLGPRMGSLTKLARITNTLSLQCGLCPCPSHQMHPRKVAPCQGGGVLSTLCLFCCFRDTQPIRCRVCSPKTLVESLVKRACILPIHPPSTSPHLKLSGCQAACGLCCPFCVQNMSPTASSLGPRIFPVSCTLSPLHRQE